MTIRPEQVDLSDYLTATEIDNISGHLNDKIPTDYYTQGEVDNISGSLLALMPTDFYTQSEVDGISGNLNSSIQAEITTLSGQILDVSGNINVSGNNVIGGFLFGDGSNITNIAAAGSTDQVTLTARKSTGGTIAVGEPVYLTGYNIGTGKYEVEIADSDDPTKMPAIGLASTVLSNVADGTVVTAGALTSVNTSAWAVGDSVYVSTSGQLDHHKPIGGTTSIQKMGQVLRSNVITGVIQVVGAGRSNDIPNSPSGQFAIGTSSGIPEYIDNTLANITDVYLDTPASGQILGYDGTSWYNTSAGAGGVTDHGALTGLDDDDHSAIYYPISDVDNISGSLLALIPTDFYTQAQVDTISGSLLDLIPTGIADLDDVTLTSPANDEVLTYNGSAWVNAAGGGGGGGITGSTGRAWICLTAAQASAGLAITTGTTPVPFAEQLIVDSGYFSHNRTTNPERLYTNVSGWYSISFALTEEELGGGSAKNYGLILDGTPISFSAQYSNCNGTDHISFINLHNYIVECVSGNYIEIQKTHVWNNDQANIRGFSHMEAHYIGV